MIVIKCVIRLAARAHYRRITRYHQHRKPRNILFASYVGVATISGGGWQAGRLHAFAARHVVEARVEPETRKRREGVTDDALLRHRQGRRRAGAPCNASPKGRHGICYIVNSSHGIHVALYLSQCLVGIIIASLPRNLEHHGGGDGSCFCTG